MPIVQLFATQKTKKVCVYIYDDDDREKELSLGLRLVLLIQQQENIERKERVLHFSFPQFISILNLHSLLALLASFLDFFLSYISKYAAAMYVVVIERRKSFGCAVCN